VLGSFASVPLFQIFLDPPKSGGHVVTSDRIHRVQRDMGHPKARILTDSVLEPQDDRVSGSAVERPAVVFERQIVIE
jgi:hypothetical protein